METVKMDKRYQVMVDMHLKFTVEVSAGSARMAEVIGEHYVMEHYKELTPDAGSIKGTLTTGG